MPLRRALSALSVSALACCAQAQAPDAAAGPALAERVCAACHGANGISVSDAIPNLAGQRAAYLENQLKALRDGTRKSDVMNAVAAQLQPREIAGLAAHFASLAGAGAGAPKSAFLPPLARTQAALPDRAAPGTLRFGAENLVESRQVRHLYANAVAAQAAREGRPLPDGSMVWAEVHAAKLDGAGLPQMGADGLYVPDRMLATTVMHRDAGFGRDIPELLRNENWNYAVFGPDRQPRASANQAECLACHKPRASSSFVFTLDKLAAAARQR